MSLNVLHVTNRYYQRRIMAKTIDRLSFEMVLSTAVNIRIMVKAINELILKEILSSLFRVL